MATRATRQGTTERPVLPRRPAALGPGLAALLLLALGACAAPKPVLYPNAHLQAVGQAVAERDIEDCRLIADAAGASSGSGRAATVAGSTAVGGGVGGATGAVGGAILGAAGTGAAVGAATGATAGLLRGIFRRPRPSQAYMGFVNRCLVERGYEPVGWD